MLDLDISVEGLDEDQAFSQLLMLQKNLHEATDPTALIHIYDEDQTFHDLFNKSGDPIANIDKYVAASNEGLLQDYLVYGLVGLIGNMEYANLGRIRTICQKFANSNVPDVDTNWSLYLPSYGEFHNLIDRLDALYKGFVAFQKDPNGDIKKIIDPLRRAGVKVNYNGDVSSLVGIDWKAVAGSLIARALHTVIITGVYALTGAAGVGLVASALMNPVHGHTGAHIGSDNGCNIGGRGWDGKKLGEAAKLIVKHIDQLDTLKSKPYVKESDPEFAEKLRFAKSAFKAYTKVLQDIGRGVASAFTAGSYNGRPDRY